VRLFVDFIKARLALATVAGADARSASAGRARPQRSR
jgi:hypothetical protein